MKQDEFNEQIIASMRATGDDPEIQNWVATTYGRHCYGLEIEEEKLPKECPCCNERQRSIAKRRLNTAYANDAENWLVSCKSCFDEAVEMYAEMWADYWAGR